MNSDVMKSIPRALSLLKQGKMIIVVDDEDRENEGDFIMAAEACTPEDVNFMASEGRGLICTPITEQLADKLRIRPMTGHNSSAHGTAFTVSIDAAKGISTGISASDRSKTIQLLAQSETNANDLVTPGHIFPLIANPKGVFGRNGHTEASVDLVKLAGFSPVAVICEIMLPDGSMARRVHLEEIANKWGLEIFTIKDLVHYRHLVESTVTRKDQIELPTLSGAFTLTHFVCDHSGRDIVVLIPKNADLSKKPLVRVHSSCATGDIFGSLRCECGDQLSTSMDLISRRGNGAVVYLQQEGRGIGLGEKIRAYKLQEMGYDTVEANRELGHGADERDYYEAFQVLRDLGMLDIDLLTNNPSKVDFLTQCGVQVKRVSIEIKENTHNKNYLTTKVEKMGHWMSPSPLMSSKMVNSKEMNPESKKTNNKDNLHALH